MNSKMDPVDESPPAKKIKQISPRDINGLSDADLSEIFKRLPLVDRLLISEVCKRWYAITKQTWLDITHIDLSAIPGPNITAIVKQCPNLRTIFAKQKVFRPSELYALARVDLQSLTFYDCKVVGVAATPANLGDPLTAAFGGFVRSANWQELVLDDGFLVEFDNLVGQNKVTIDLPASFPNSLKRLQLNKLASSINSGRHCCNAYTSLQGIERLGELECLMLSSPCSFGPNNTLIRCALRFSNLAQNIGAMRDLRELLISSMEASHVSPLLGLANLETLFLHDFDLDLNNADFVTFVTKHPALRILVFIGYSGSYVKKFPARLRYGNGFNAEPLPKLHIFVGKGATQHVRFPKFPSDAAKVYAISEPLPQFLDREDIKPIFEGVWIAEKIKVAAKQGSVLYDYAGDVAFSFR